MWIDHEPKLLDMLCGFIEFAIQKSNHEKFLRIVLSIIIAELLVTKDHLNGIVLLVIVDDFILIVKVNARSYFFHVLRAQFHGITYKFDLRPKHIEIDFVKLKRSLLFHEDRCFLSQIISKNIMRMSDTGSHNYLNK